MLKKVLIGIALSSALLFSFTQRENIEKIENQNQAIEPVDYASSTAAEKFMLDPKKCKVEWVGKGVGKQHTGTVDITTGSITIDTKQITGLYAYMDMKTIKCSDIKDEGFNKQLCDHLKGPDFFQISKYPSTTFKVTKATRLDVPEGQVNYTIVGDLAMHGVTKSISFPATVTFAKKKVTAKAEFPVDRTQWNVKYNSGNYFKDLGDKLIKDTIDMKIYLEGNVQ